MKECGFESRSAHIELKRGSAGLYRMESKLKRISDIKRSIELTISVENVNSEFERILRTYSARVKVPGFRPGKVPLDLIRQRYSADIREEVVNSLLPRVLNDELKALRISPVGMPVVTDMEFDEGKPLRFTAEFEVWPEFTLPSYKKLRIESKDPFVGDEEVERMLEDIRKQSAQYVPTEDRGVIDGDYVVAEVKGRDVKTKKFLPTDKVVILANHPDNEKALNENIGGLKTGQETRFSVEYKNDHANKKLAGRTIEYTLKVESIKERKLPEIDDDFAKELGEYKDLQELKVKLREQIADSKRKSQRQEMAVEALKKISDAVSIEIPEAVVERESVTVLQRMMQSAPQKKLAGSLSQLSPDEIEKLRQDAQSKARENIKNHLILTRIAAEEKLEVTEKEFQEEVQRIAEANRVSPAQVTESLSRQGQKDEVMENLLIRKTVDFLVDNAIIK